MQGSCYKISSKAVNWNSAKSACEALGSTLAMIKSQAEQQALAPNISRTGIPRTNHAGSGLMEHRLFTLPGVTANLIMLARNVEKLGRNVDGSGMITNVTMLIITFAKSMVS